jgi:hypothetical protein
MDGLNAGAQWAFDRLASLDPGLACWHGPAVVTAMRRHFIALGLSEPDWVQVVGSPAEARELTMRHRRCPDSYWDATRRRARAELDGIDAVSKSGFDAGIDRVFGHPLTEALVQVLGGWEANVDRCHRNSVIFEVAVAVGARGAVLSADLIWTWDQAQMAFEHGLGWFTLVEDGLILLPRPTLVMPGDWLHRTDGPAVQWPDGTGQYYVEGVEFGPDEHRRLVGRSMTAAEALAFPTAEQELLAIAAAPSDDVLALLHAVHVDTGIKGTRLYRISGHFDRDRDDYCITMIDPSTGRTYLEWVDPEIGQLRDAELCQAHLFGIDIRDWLSLQSEA